MTQPEIYFSVDIEASGPIPGEYSMLSLGACLVDAPDRTFYAELQPISQQYVPDALRVSRFDLQGLARTGQEPSHAMRAFRDWLAHTAASGTPIFVGFNASFDWAFVNWYFHKYLGTNPFGIGALDIKAYYMGLTGCRWEETRSTKLPSCLQAPAKSENRHNALSDSIRQAGIFRSMIDLRAELLKR